MARFDHEHDLMLTRITAMEQTQREMQEKYDSLQTETRAVKARLQDELRTNAADKARLQDELRTNAADKARLQDELRTNADRLISLERQVAATASNQRKWDCAGTKRKAQTAQTCADGAMQKALEAESVSSATKLAQEADRTRVTRLERQVWDLSSPCFELTYFPE